MFWQLGDKGEVYFVPRVCTLLESSLSLFLASYSFFFFFLTVHFPFTLKVLKELEGPPLPEIKVSLHALNFSISVAG